jgi:allantoate deiminase
MSADLSPAQDSLAQATLDQIHHLATLTDEPDVVTRTFLSPAMATANVLVGGWMKEAGGEVSEDGWGNLIGHWAAATDDAPTLLLGSHLDTVPNAGKFDGPLGVLVALASVKSLAARDLRLPFHVDIIGFSDEEGTRFHSAYLGSSALAGLLKETDFDLRDGCGISLRQAVATYQRIAEVKPPAARYRPRQLLGYVEVHIEQGPVLEKMGLPLGVVDAIAAQYRLVYTLEGRAGHAGTTPMNLRADALAGAAELVLAIEQIGLFTPGLVATVGQLQVEPGASNVIPNHVHLSVDIRHAETSVAKEACAQLAAKAEAIAKSRGLQISHVVVQNTDGVNCAPDLVRKLVQAVEKQQPSVPHLVSGAGHDGIILSRVTSAAMLFVRCKNGLSHHPDEHVDLSDIAAAIRALTTFLENFA